MVLLDLSFFFFLKVFLLKKKEEEKLRKSITKKNITSQVSLFWNLVKQLDLYYRYEIQEYICTFKLALLCFLFYFFNPFLSPSQVMDTSDQ